MLPTTAHQKLEEALLLLKQVTQRGREMAEAQRLTIERMRQSLPIENYPAE
jgi:hypothetical protein